MFSHVSDADALGKETLPDLIEYLTNEKEQRILQLSLELSEVNVAIVALEDQLTDEYRKGVESRLEQRRSENKAHDEARPCRSPEPSQDPNEQAATDIVKQELAELVRDSQRLDEQLSASRQHLRDAALQVAAAESLLARIENLEKARSRLFTLRVRTTVTS